MSTSEELRVDDGLDNPAVFRAVEEYLAAIQLGRRPDRASFLAQYPDLADEIAECLDALEFVQGAASSLDGTDRQRDKSNAGLPEPGTTLGDYCILREVGRGGMGVVYEAQQLSLDRRVALKVLPFAMTLDPRQLQRFKHEAQAAASLQHGNVVPVFAVGCEQGVHFYAMQFVEGHTLAALVTDLRRKKREDSGRTSEVGTTPDALTTEESAASDPANTDCELISSFVARDSGFSRDVARLGVEAAEALDYAHQMGIVHRDIKPGNLMVEADGHLWVTDFGLARCQGDAALTAPGDVVGTLRYMPPEQALAFRDLVDHRADVYSLGATLYELLTLAPPFTGRDRRELLHQIEHEEPRPLRRLNPTVPVDLETIVLKALSKNVADRYATAQAMADDLQRFLEDRPIQARRPSVRERLARWTRRHATLIQAASVVLLLAVLGLAATTLLVARAHEQAEENFQKARAAVDFFAKVSSEELPDDPELLAVRQKLLSRALAYYEDFIERRRDDPTTAEALRNARAQVAQIREHLELLTAVAAANEQLRLLEAKAGPAPSVEGSELYELLLEKPVQAELNLTREQLRQIDQLRSPLPDSERQHRERAFLMTFQPAQLRRIRQIALQKRGADALTDPRIITALGLSGQQRERIQRMLAEMQLAHGMSFAVSKPPEWAVHLPRLLDILTPSQRALWREMAGEPYHGNEPTPRFPVRNPQQPPRPGGQVNLHP